MNSVQLFWLCTDRPIWRRASHAVLHCAWQPFPLSPPGQACNIYLYVKESNSGQRLWWVKGQKQMSPFYTALWRIQTCIIMFLPFNSPESPPHGWKQTICKSKAYFQVGWVVHPIPSTGGQTKERSDFSWHGKWNAVTPKRKPDHCLKQHPHFVYWERRA